MMVKKISVALLLTLSAALSSNGRQAGITLPGHPNLELLISRSGKGSISAEKWSLLPLSTDAVDRLLAADSLNHPRPERSALFSISKVGNFFEDGRNLWSTSEGPYTVRINPVVDLRAGYSGLDRAATSESGGAWWKYERGVRLSGNLGTNWFLDAKYTEVQEKVIDPLLLTQGTLARKRNIQYEPTCNRSRCREDEISNVGQYDYGPVTGTVGFDNGQARFQLGRQRLRMGYALNSLLLSGYASELDHVLFRLELERFTYTFLLTQGMDPLERSPAGTPKRKSLAIHRLALRITPGFHVAVFDAALVTADTTAGISNPLELAMFNPLLNLRQVEKDFGRFGNKLMGIETNFAPSAWFRGYGQFILDEFEAREIFAGDGYWANKWGFLLGMQFNVPLGLTGYVIIEYAQVRPFTYSHEFPSSSYSHYGDVLGHPAGSNFRDISTYSWFQMSRVLHSSFTASYTWQGTGLEGANLGSDPLINYNTRESDYGHRLLQGTLRNTLVLDARLSLELLPDLFLDGSVQLNQVLLDKERELGMYLVHAGLRWNAGVLTTRN